jgi:2-C-methyl-D-erythritol 4-phosphate cytidylyltransferase
MKEYIIIVAGGTGSRMKSDVPKQFMLIHNKAILLHTIEKFVAYNSHINIIVSCHKNFIKHTHTLIENQPYYKQTTIVEGGETRFHSVKNGLNAIAELTAIVGIHDAARPLVSVETIKRCYVEAQEKGNAIPVVALSESIRKIENETSAAADRSLFKIVQTPQCFSVSRIKEAFETHYSPLFTDDATVLENAGHKINLVEGNPENIKITHPIDIAIAEALLKG